MISPAVVAEVRALESAGKLNAASILERARDPQSALHAEFDWDDQRAAHAHRLVVAERLIIRVRVRIEQRPDETPKKVRVQAHADAAGASLRPKRAPKPARPEPTPMPKKPQLSVVPPPRPPGDGELAHALYELAGWRAHWEHLPELAPLYQELSRLDRLQRLMDAVRHARELEQRGYARPEAAEQAASMFRQPRTEVLRLLRAS